MAEQEKWKWQEPGTTWKGVGLYHITLTITDRQPLLGTLTIPNNDPTKARVNRTALGNALVNCLLSIQRFHPEVQVLHFCLMPDHLHAVLYVRHTMPKGIGAVVRGFWQGAKKLVRAYTAASCLEPNGIRQNYQEEQPAEKTRENHQEKEAKQNNQEEARQNHQEKEAKQNNQEEARQNHQEKGGEQNSQEEARQNHQEKEAEQNNQEKAGQNDQGKGLGNLREDTVRMEAFSSALREQMGDDAYYSLEAIFTEMPFIRPMGHNTQLPNTIRYIDMNPQRLATKRLKPGFFRVQQGITIGERSYDGVGNATLLMGKRFDTVHVRSFMVKAAEHGNSKMLRNYMNSCVLKARQGTIMVSPFISTQEKEVMEVLLREHLPFICLSNNGFRDYYKPADTLFDACASGRVLILSPWPYDADKRHISREECVALNAMAEEICNLTIND